MSKKDKSINELNPSNPTPKLEPVNPVNPDTGTAPAPEDRVKRKYTKRKSKDASFKLSKDIVAPLCDFPFNFMAGRWGGHWKLTPEERSQMAAAFVPVANKYLPDIIDRWGEEISLGFVMFAIIAGKAAQGFGEEG